MNNPKIIDIEKRLKALRFRPIIYGGISLFFLIMVILLPTLENQWKIILFLLGFVPQFAFYYFDGFKIGASSSTVKLIEMFGSISISIFVIASMQYFVYIRNLIAILALDVLLLAILKIIITNINLDNSQFFRIWLGIDGIITLILSILIFIYSIGNDEFNVILFTICLLLAGITNMLYTILWKTEKGIKGIIENKISFEEEIKIAKEKRKEA